MIANKICNFKIKTLHYHIVGLHLSAILNLPYNCYMHLGYTYLLLKDALRLHV